jgi:hypothetical protein
MSKAKERTANADMRPEYDFSGGVRGKYYRRFQKGTNVVLLEPDVSAAFPDSASVNEALRVLASVARRTTAATRRTPSARRRLNKRTQLGRSTKARRRSPHR